MIVTDFKWRKTRKGEIKTGYYMANYLRQNLDGIPNFLSKSWDVVGIISGHGKVRIGKSTCAMQVGYYIAWRLAGGQMIVDDKNQVKGVQPPNKPVHFGLENIVFSPDQLMSRAIELYEKYGKHQVIIYDEGRAGLDSARAMESINKAMVDFFQECGVYGHVILVVLPNFFKLHEDYAVARSIFLIDVFADRNFKRGYFNFYGEKQKERLYFFGKKMIGVSAKYYSAHPNFWGKFTSFIPVNKKKYEEMKSEAIKHKKVTKTEARITKQRNILSWIAVKLFKMYGYHEKQTLAILNTLLPEGCILGEQGLEAAVIDAREKTKIFQQIDLKMKNLTPKLLVETLVSKNIEENVVPKIKSIKEVVVPKTSQV